MSRFDLSDRTILLVGATGFIGSHLLDALIETGARVIAPVRNLPEAASKDDQLQCVRVPQFSPMALRDALVDCSWDFAINAAAYGVSPSDRDPTTMFNINVACAVELVLLCAEKNCQGFVQIGSCSEYDVARSVMPLREEAPLETEKLYGASKASASVICKGMAAQLNLPFAVARLFNVYGPREPSHRLLPSLIQSLSDMKDVELSAGTQTRDFCHIKDITSAILTLTEGLLKDASGGGIYNICTGIQTSVRDFALTAAEVADLDLDLLKFGALPMRPDDVDVIYGDGTAMEQRFGWTYEIELCPGIKDVVLSIA